MTLHLVIATALICAAGWWIPAQAARFVRLPQGALAIVCVMVLFVAGLGIMWAMDVYGYPLRFTDPAAEGAFLFSAVALCVPGAAALMVRLALLHRPK